MKNLISIAILAMPCDTLQEPKDTVFEYINHKLDSMEYIFKQVKEPPKENYNKELILNYKTK